jgi:hypothetical protein
MESCLGENQPMTASSSNRDALLPADGIQSLLGRKEQVQEEAQGRIPDRLLHGTVQTVMRLVRGKADAEVLTPRVLYLVCQSLRGMRSQPLKVDTALVLHKRPEGKKHGTAQ